MPLNLVSRAGGETLGKLESAARLRFREAKTLDTSGEKLGAIYLYGYSVEIRLKAAYYRVIGLVSSTSIDAQLHRRPAENAIKVLPRLPTHARTGGPAPGHNVVGWARFLDDTRAGLGRPLSSGFARKLHGHSMTIFACWAEILRYRANRPYNAEIEAVRAAAQWYRTNAGRLWR